MKLDKILFWAVTVSGLISVAVAGYVVGGLGLAVAHFLIITLNFYNFHKAGQQSVINDLKQKADEYIKEIK